MSTGLFADEEDEYNIEETKYKLKVDNKTTSTSDDSLDDLEDLSGDEDLKGLEDLNGDKDSDKPFDDEPFDAGVEADEETEPEKFIQQLSGKLGQTLRKYTKERGEPNFDLEKYAVNSVLSATHTGEMDEEDQKDIIKKVKTAGKGEGDIDVKVDVDTDADNEEVTINNDKENGKDLDLGDEVTKESIDDFGDDDIRRFYNAIVTRKSDGIKGRVVRWDNGKLKIEIIDGPNSGKFFSAYPSEVELNTENFNLGERKTPVENLEFSLKKRNFVNKSVIINKLNETFMTETQPQTKPAPTTVPQTKPDVKPSRRQKPWRPNKRPKVNPKASGDKNLIMNEGDGSDGRIINTKFLDSNHAILTINLDNNEVDIKFENTGEVLNKPKSYDEPLVYDYHSINAPDGNTYRVGVEFYGSPENKLEIGGINNEYIEQING